MNKPNDENNLTVESGWNSFCSGVLSSGVTSDTIQYKEMKKAYVAGYSDCFILINELLINELLKPGLTEYRKETLLLKIGRELHELIDGIVDNENKSRI